ncbi:hypothetical protein CL622_08485, partial [archaeon]|nr:hypothetical protein [archaeon]
MAGGIFIDRPFHANPKCIVLSILAMVSYWFLPYRNPYMLPVLFVVIYVVIAWYDHLYKCEDKLFSGNVWGLNVFDLWPKPQRRTDKGSKPRVGNLVKDQEGAY